MTGLTVGVLAERADGERRVALDPDGVRRYLAVDAPKADQATGTAAGADNTAAGAETTAGADNPAAGADNAVNAGGVPARAVLVESGCGAAAWFADEQYAEAGATVTDRATVLAGADAIVSVGRPTPDVVAGLRAGQILIGLLAPATNPELVRSLAAARVTAISLDQLPRTLSRAQGMDALSSQANAAGYRAVLVAAEHFDRFFPLLITAAGTSKPATVLVLGAGVAGLQAIGTARRLGAVVSGYDVRPAAREEVTSLGAKFVELSTSIAAAGTGGYARELTQEERDAQQAELGEHISRQDIVITTAQVPGRRPPLLVTEAAVAAMRPGSVIVDMAASELGGNVAGSVPGQTVVTANGVTVVGATNLPAQLATSASATYSRNVGALLAHLIGPDGQWRWPAGDEPDEITAGVLITRDGQVVHPGIRAAIGETA